MKPLDLITLCICACTVTMLLLPKFHSFFLYIHLLLILSPCAWSLEWFGKQSVTEDASQSTFNVQHVDEMPLSEEEKEAIAASKRIVANAREKFLKENGGSVPMASPQAQEYMSKAAEIFKANLDESTSAEGKTWVQQYKNDIREVKVSSAEFPGYPCKRWKVEAILKTDMASAYDAMFVPEKRRKWDILVKDIQMVQIHDCSPSVGDGLAITAVFTNPVLVVSSRSMLDLALQRCQPRGGIHIVNASFPSNFDEAKRDPGLNGTVRATTHLGSGALIEPIPGRPGYLRYVLVSTIGLGGWLPPSVVNATMTTSLVQSTEQMQDFFSSGEKIA